MINGSGCQKSPLPFDSPVQGKSRRGAKYPCGLMVCDSFLKSLFPGFQVYDRSTQMTAK